MTDYTLKHGSHGSPEEGLCAMEWVAYLAGEPHSDSPVCVDSPLQSFGIVLNDAWDDEQRQKLSPYLARCIGTAGDGRTEERGWLAMDWLIRTFTPAFLDLRPELQCFATKLRNLSPVMAADALAEAMPLLTESRDAARAAVGDAARDAVGAAVGAAARAAAWDAARAAARDAVGDAARDAVGAAVGAALESTVATLQDSALDLFDRMLPTEAIELPAPKAEAFNRLVAAK